MRPQIEFAHLGQVGWRGLENWRRGRFYVGLQKQSIAESDAWMATTWSFTQYRRSADCQGSGGLEKDLKRVSVSFRRDALSGWS